MSKILFFSGKFCGPCRAIKSQMTEDFAKENNIEIVDIEENVSLTVHFKVMNVPTFVKVDSEGKEVKRHIGSIKLEDLASL